MRIETRNRSTDIRVLYCLSNLCGMSPRWGFQGYIPCLVALPVCLIWHHTRIPRHIILKIIRMHIYFCDKNRWELFSRQSPSCATIHSISTVPVADPSKCWIRSIVALATSVLTWTLRKWPVPVPSSYKAIPFSPVNIRGSWQQSPPR